MRLLDALGRYLAQLEADGRSVHTRSSYERHIRLLAEWLDDGELEAITHEALAAFMVSPEARSRPDGKPKKATAVNVLRSSLRTFFAFCHGAGYAPTNPARLIRRARTASPPPRGLSVAEQRRLLDVLAEAQGEQGERDRVLFEVMLATGIRIGSALALDVGDVDVAGGQLYLRTMKGGGGQTVYFNPRIGALLVELIGDRTEGPLFQSRHRRRLSVRQAQRRLTIWLGRAGCRQASPHALRHSFGQGLYELTGDVLLVREAMGHRSIASSMAYVRPKAEQLRALMAGSISAAQSAQLD